MPDNEKREVRFTVLLTKEEWEDLQGRAGLVPVAVWLRAMLFRAGTEVSGSGETGKVEVPPRFQPGEAVRLTDLPKISKTSSPPTNKSTCPHGKHRGEHCWQCAGIAKVGG